MGIRRTVVPYGRLAMREAKLAAARDQQQGVQVLSFEQLVTRLAGGFARPIDADTLKQVLREALPTAPLGLASQQMIRTSRSSAPL